MKKYHMLILQLVAEKSVIASSPEEAAALVKQDNFINTIMGEETFYVQVDRIEPLNPEEGEKP